MSTPRRVEEIVKAALELRHDERDAFLTDVCGDDADLRRRVEVWLRVHTGGPIATPTEPVPRPSAPTPSPSHGWAGLAIAGLLVLLIGALGLAGWALLAAQREAERANAEAQTAREAEAARAQEGLRRMNLVQLQHLRQRIDALQGEEKFAQAEPLLREAVELLEEATDKPLDRATQLVCLGWNLLAQEKYADAEPVLRDALEQIEKGWPGGWPQLDTRSLLGASLAGQKRYQDAEPLLLAAYEGLKGWGDALPEKARDRVREAGLRVVALYQAWGKKESAEAWKRKLGL